MTNFQKHKWFNPFAYDHEKMIVQRDPIQGDFNWIFENTVLAMASPISNIPYDPKNPLKSGKK